MSAPPWSLHLPAGSAPVSAGLADTGSLPALWARRWEEAPQAAAVWHAATGWTSAAELEERSRRVAGRLAGAGISAGDRVLVSAEASRDLVVSLVAVLRLGAVVVPVNAGCSIREIAHVVADASPAAAIVADAAQAARVQECALPPRLVSGPDLDSGSAPGGSGLVTLDRCAPTDPALVCYTSGTTGVPKGAVLSHGNVTASLAALRIAWRWTAQDRLVLALPLHHLHGLGVGLLGTLAAGASCVLLPRFGAGAVLDAASDMDATLYFGVPTMYSRIAAAGRAGELGRLRLCVSGSAPLPVELFAAVAEASGRPILERYGMSETLMLTSNPYVGERRPGSVGVPLPGVHVRLADDGGIHVRGPNVFSRYWRRPEATAAVLGDDGWFETGDVGAMDADGYLRIVGRSSDLIISGGYNVYPREVEDVLLGDPQVAEVAVVGLADPDLGEEVVAVVVPAAGTAAAEATILDRARHGLARYKVPRRVVFVASLPRNSVGKVVRSELLSELSQ